MLRSQSDPNSARSLTALPVDPGLCIRPERFQFLLRRRLRLPVLLTSRQCEGCGAELDGYGDHYTSCIRTGRVQARAKPFEHTWVRVLREAGATLHPQKLLCEVTAIFVE